MYEALKNLKVLVMNKDDLEEALVATSQLVDGYGLADVEVPRWLATKHSEVRRYYEIAVENALMAEIELDEAAQLHDMTPSERRRLRQAGIDEKRAKLEALRHKPARSATPTTAPVVAPPVTEEVHEH